MSLSNPNKPITKGDLKQFYDTIRPYMGGLVSSKAGYTPVGTIISVMGTTAPANYIACNGQIVNVADYQELADYFENQFGTKYKFGGSGTTFGIPDLRGEFLRGTGTNSHADQGSGEDVGEHQDATAVPNMVITGTQNANMLQIYWNEGYKYPQNPDGNVLGKQGLWNNYNRSNAGAGESYGFINVRPTNTSVLYCIATKNFYIDPSHDYSTSEKVIGTWVDGKPIYQKTIEVNNPSSQGSATVNHNISNLDLVIDMKGFGIRNDYCMPFPTGATTTSVLDWATMLNGVNKTEIFYTIGINNSGANAMSKVYFTLQYTKTTD